MTSDQLVELVHCRARRRFTRGLKRKPMVRLLYYLTALTLAGSHQEAPQGQERMCRQRETRHRQDAFT